MNQHLSELSAFDRFRAMIGQDDTIEHLRAGLIGENAEVPGPNGPNKMIYADYVASGRALRQVEDFIACEVLPYYANSHTEASFCGQTMTRMRNAARREILRICGGDARHAAIFTGSGATAGLNRLTRLLGVSDAAPGG